MSTLQMVTVGLALAGAAICTIGIITLIVAAQRRPYRTELAPTKGSPVYGVLYAFTIGMAPWAKESARRHWVAYIRGIIFHISIFIGIALLLASPWSAEIPTTVRLSIVVVLVVGTVTGLAGFWIRWHDPTMRLLSTPDDYFSLGMTTLFLASGALSAALVELLPAFWAISGVTMAYVPFSKLRHFVYFFYARIFLGLTFGRRGVLE